MVTKQRKKKNMCAYEVANRAEELGLTHKQADIEIWDNILLERAKQLKDKEQIELSKS